VVCDDGGVGGHVKSNESEVVIGLGKMELISSRNNARKIKRCES